ncbi:uncharacterized protein LOC112686330 [Sipha flava]|uniref:Uncharacterized protein LOC112686330 n=1 Tax=Sipha flava TaxID=143950 RepID=A0A8B8FV12_9HEMI|nr:uncharacterized protein LOC112686330 [Sipha flava]
MQFNPVRMYVDFEKAIHTAANVVWPSIQKKKLITYFEETYVLGKIDIWSVYNRVRLEHSRTTNTAESWQRKLNRLTSPHPGLHKFITIVQKIQAETESRIKMLISGDQINEIV